MLKVFNTLGREKQEFIPLNDKSISFYHCGPTVYWTQHLGNMRAMVMGDLIRRSLMYLYPQHEVKYVRNYTDFGHLTSDDDHGEDKMEKASKREGLDPQAIANKYIKEFERDTRALNILEPTVKTRATEYLDGMIEMVQTLLEKGYAYSTPKAIYFDISKFEDYTKLSGRDLEKDMAGAGSGEVEDTDKKNPADFALWFFKTGAHKNALQYWNSPFDSPKVENGEGIPGWHIECSAMACKVLGATLDFHMGGVEHISIHHSNEIAQSEAANGVKFANYWLHNEHLLMDGQKMSKSLGNVNSLQNIVDEGYNPLHVRYFFLGAHYRSKQNFTIEALEAAKSAYEKIQRFVEGVTDTQSIEANRIFKEKFINALEDDFNIPSAVAILWEVIKSDLSEAEKYSTIIDFDKVLGLDIKEMRETKDDEISEEVQKIINERDEARKNKDWELSDSLRNRLGELGYEVFDTAEGTNVKRK